MAIDYAELEIGKLIEGQGIYLGEWSFPNVGNVKMDKTYYLFAAPEDLSLSMTFNEAVDHVSNLKNYHGHNGIRYKSETDIHMAVQFDLYDGQWFIPTHSILEHAIFKNHNKGSLKDSFNTQNLERPLYASCSNHTLFPDEAIWGMDFNEGGNVCYRSDDRPMLFRVVRAVEKNVTEDDLDKKFRKHLPLKKRLKLRGTKQIK